MTLGQVMTMTGEEWAKSGDERSIQRGNERRERRAKGFPSLIFLLCVYTDAKSMSHRVQAGRFHWKTGVIQTWVHILDSYTGARILGK